MSQSDKIIKPHSNPFKEKEKCIQPNSDIIKQKTATKLNYSIVDQDGKVLKPYQDSSLPITDINNPKTKIQHSVVHNTNDVITPHVDPFKKIQRSSNAKINKLKVQSSLIIKPPDKRKIIFKNFQSPGDIIMLTAAVRDLKLSYPEIQIDVRTTGMDIWEHNPNLTSLNENDTDVETINIGYPLIHQSNEGQYHFIHGFRKDIENKLNLKIKPTKFKGDIHLSSEEYSWMSQIQEMDIHDDFWIIVAGGKFDYSCKWWHPQYYQEIVNHFKDQITFVQVGEEGHWHPPLENVINLIGKTDLRQFIRLIYHSAGIVCPITFAMHAAAAIPTKAGRLKNRPCVVIAGGREPSQWEKYPHHRFLETNGCLDCCDNGGCWTSRCQKVGDGDEKDTKNTCKYPIQIQDELIIPKCMYMIKPQDVIRAIEMYRIHNND